ncbi:hypothetical protein KB879_33545 (plasmid) [Cupriavidus sp. KK10]|jgi:hypothetical protein|uniref:hypothetical protein n=1 Tax=Cupriavidus sp. KK10 TaxID=1478019 RepID=UPI001BA8C55A|nr:hypothetical protein [Cupriavidus sp. KK10]QUN32546.1 hypothetical protein KB879_33545 [Cupriavidus sp. KK10]
MPYLTEGASPEQDLVPVPWFVHSVVWIEKSQLPDYREGLGLGLLVAVVCAMLVLEWMLLS